MPPIRIREGHFEHPREKLGPPKFPHIAKVRMMLIPMYVKLNSDL